MSFKISLVINTLNEEQNISDCINSAKGFYEEVIVCDMHSEDKTREIASSLGARVIMHKRIKFFDIARKYAIEQAKGEWILILDADERLTAELKSEMVDIINRNHADAVKIRMKYEFMGGWIENGTWGGNYFLRLFRKQTYLERIKSDQVTVHSLFPGMANSSKTVFAKNHIIHHAYPSLHKFTFKTLHYYSRLEAESRHSRGEKIKTYHLLTRPTIDFVRSYIRRMGFRDGIRGFISSVGLAMYRFLIIAHQYELEWGDSNSSENDLQAS